MAKHTKETLTQALLAKGFQKDALDGLSKTDLLALYEEATKGDAPVNENAQAANLEDFDGDTIHVHGADGYIRTYSEEEHGEDFLDLAKSFASKDAARFLVL